MTSCGPPADSSAEAIAAIPGGQNDGTLHITWYLSPELGDLEHLKIADAYLAKFVSAHRRLGGAVNTLVRPPFTGERRPPYSLPLPAVNAEGQTVFLWSSLVLNRGDRQVVIPDIWETQWLPLDLSRSIADLENSGPLPLVWIDGAGLPDDPVAALAGRWTVEEWEFGISIPSGIQAVIVSGGRLLDGRAEALAVEMAGWVEAGIPVVFLPRPHRERAGDLENLIAPGGGSQENGITILRFSEDPVRELDVALLELVDRREILVHRPETGKRPIIDDTRGSEPAGHRLGHRRFTPKGVSARRLRRAERITFVQEESGVPGVQFSLEKKRDGGWMLVAGDWRLPARDDRIRGFLGRLTEGAGEAWDPGRLFSDQEARLTLRFEAARRRSEVLSVRKPRASGGVYMRYRGRNLVWPRIVPDDVRGDARYWMERRLYPDSSVVVRMELTSKNRLYWRLHQENERWKTTDGNGRTRISDGDEARTFARRLLTVESTVIAPVDFPVVSPLMLVMEDDRGRRVEYRIEESPDGRIGAVSDEGVFHILDDVDLDFILAGPRGPRLR